MDELGQPLPDTRNPQGQTAGSGGQMVVRLSHPDSEQVFVVQLKLDS